ncbi:zinc-dependent alcohol dehydrogenase family protein [Bifidobacterium thermacidophilum]|uniref:zinc-dependent alcohol dehydrogenase family protein n=1 Tax=Bifidobacterium thermacidophilum TaxID=246618 RepID=UPI003F09F3AE
MKSTIYYGPHDVRVEERPIPTIKNPGDLIIRVVRTCVCGSDLWPYRSQDANSAGTPIGHESIGVVTEIGADVTAAKPGDFVIVPFPISCGECAACKAGFESSCLNGGYFGGAEGEGCQSEYLHVPHADGTVVNVSEALAAGDIPGAPASPAEFSDEMLADLLTLSDVMGTGYHAAVSAEVKPGDTAVVFGDGAVGLCGVLSAKLLGAARIIAMSRHDDRAAIAREFGATDIVPERDDAAVARVMELTGSGADVVLECVGSAQSFNTALRVGRPGAVIGRVGLPHGVQIPADATFYRNIGIKGGPAPVRTYARQRLLREVLAGNIHPGRVFTKTYTLDEVPQAYADMDARRVIKALVKVSEVEG